MKRQPLEPLDWVTDRIHLMKSCDSSFLKDDKHFLRKAERGMFITKEGDGIDMRRLVEIKHCGKCASNKTYFGIAICKESNILIRDIVNKQCKIYKGDIDL